MNYSAEQIIHGNYTRYEFDEEPLPMDRDAQEVADEMLNEPTIAQRRAFFTALSNSDEFMDCILGLAGWDLGMATDAAYKSSAMRVTQLAQEIALELAENNEI